MLWNHFVQQHFDGDTCLYETRSGTIALVKVTRVEFSLGKYQYYVESLGEKYPISAYTTTDKLVRVFDKHTFHVPNDQELVAIVGGGR